ncbi:hypothetical protein PCCS19_42390 [Paenibacillus sp. CCS19]|nr:hypothetical protein PCCS19_42390 [Paenibacillus cellulosilyticus]
MIRLLNKPSDYGHAPITRMQYEYFQNPRKYKLPAYSCYWILGFTGMKLASVGNRMATEFTPAPYFHSMINPHGNEVTFDSFVLTD